MRPYLCEPVWIERKKLMKSAIVKSLGVLLFAVAVMVPVSASAAEDEVPTFTKDVAPIFQAKCEACHRPGSIAPMSLVTYQEARPWARAIRERVSTRVEALAAGDLNEVLTGRLDGWRVALWMAAKRPLVGVGLGGYAAEFNVGKLELIERGVPFWRKHGVYGTFGNAHNEYLEVFSELGLVGVMALVGGAVVLWRRLRQGPRDRSVRGLGWALTASILVLSLSYFPFRSALVGYPCLASLAWLMSKDWEARSR